MTLKIVSASAEPKDDLGVDLSAIDVDSLVDELEDEVELSSEESLLLDFFHDYLSIVSSPNEDQLTSLCFALGLDKESCLPIVNALLDIRQQEAADKVKAFAADVVENQGMDELLSALEASEDEADVDEDDALLEAFADDVDVEDDIDADLDDPILDSLIEADLNGDVPSDQPEAVIVDPATDASDDELRKALNNDGNPNPDTTPLTLALNNDGDIDTATV